MKKKKALIKIKIQKYLEKLFPINRSLTGNGNRETLNIINEIIPIKINEIKSGTKAYDWKVPKEWNIKSAWIKDSSGNKIIDFDENNLHIISYSVPINKKISWNELKKHIHINKSKENIIDYRTSYYKKDWGFSVTRSQYKELEKCEGKFHIFIDSSLKNGSLSYGELLIKGESIKEILISTYICHPSMANDNLSGVLCTAFLARYLSKLKKRKWSYRVIFVPETIGALVFCNKNEKIVKRIDHGLVISNVGGPGKFGYKQSFEKSNFINTTVEQVFLENKKKYYTYPFDISGSDERQYSSQAFNINTISITKDKYYEFKEYHTSKDNLNFVNGSQINQSLNLYIDLIKKLEKWKIYKSKYVYGEMMLSKRNLYNTFGGGYLPNSKMAISDIILWVIFLSNGKVCTEEIANRIKININKVNKVAKLLVEKKIIIEI